MKSQLCNATQQLSPVLKKGGKWIWFWGEITLNFLYFGIILKLAAQHGTVDLWQKNIWNYVSHVVSMYLISDITVSTLALTLRGPGLLVGRAGASFELNNFPGNEMIFPIYLGERRGNRRQLPSVSSLSLSNSADWEFVFDLESCSDCFSTNLQRELLQDVCLLSGGSVVSLEVNCWSRVSVESLRQDASLSCKQSVSWRKRFQNLSLLPLLQSWDPLLPSTDW